jgi:hypothetical protein
MERYLPEGLIFQEILYRSEDGRDPRKPDAGGHKRQFSMGPHDIVAIGVVILAIGAVIVAIIVAMGLLFGKVPAKEGSEIIIACVSGSAISGVVAALLGRRSGSKG